MADVQGVTMTLPSKPRKYLYLKVTPTNTQTNKALFDYFMPLNVTRYIEQQLYSRMVWPERLSLVSGDIAYRLLKQYSWRLKSDRIGCYLDVPPFGRYRFTDTDPTLTTHPMKTTMDWVPVS